MGYVFISSTGEVLKRFHVLSDNEIVEIAKKHFGLENAKKKERKIDEGNIKYNFFLTLVHNYFYS